MKRLPKGMSLVSSDNITMAQLYNTVIVKLIGRKLTLNSGTWRTKHTKKCINLTMNHLKLPVHVFQEKGEWFVEANGIRYIFIDGDEFDLVEDLHLRKYL